ncbi:MAG: DEAD/DEAH box helicase, partial [Candidatus Aenigmarchaeota archaeon]|nr:DEAD/DEAH box helicase [Candidatus Aenigmarchaeota archaeon]
NPVQKESTEKGLLKRKNLVVAAPTASGKTLIGELAMLNTFYKNLGKTIYMVPLVALANEKFQNFKEKYERLGIKIAMSVGDFDSSDPFLAGYDLIIVSNEKMDSLIRHGADWIKDIGLVIVDEIHMLTDASRGPTLEITLTRLKQIIPKTQYLALSATIKNVDELSKWLDAEVVRSDWRPVKLYLGTCYPWKIDFIEKESCELNPELPVEASVSENTLNLKKQALFFVATRRSAEGLAEKLSKLIGQKLTRTEKSDLKRLADEVENILDVPTKQCKRIAKCIRGGVAFHHAGLLYKQRSLIEENFRKGLIKVIAATPTLCIPSNTLIQLSDGEIKKVSEIKIGEKIFSLNFNKFQFSNKKVIDKNSRELFKGEKLFSILTSSGQRIIVTPNHPFLIIKNGELKWLEANFLRKGDFIAYCRNISAGRDFEFNILNILPENCSPRVTNPTFHTDVIPFSGVFLEKIKKEANISSWKFRKLTGLDLHAYKRGRNLLRENATKIGNLFNPISPTAKLLLKLSSSPIKWEKIKSIRRIKRRTKVFDLTIKDSDNFIANGFIIHNSYGVNLPSFRVIMRDLKRYQPGVGAVFVPILEVQQMLGRSGRPTYDSFGEGIILAKDEDEAKEVVEHYIYGEPEEISSKLAVEPILRMHILALIASEFCKSKKSLLDFFSKTFYALQYGNIFEIEEKLVEILNLLKNWKFIEGKKDKLVATRIGKRISQLYIDPLTAHQFVDSLKVAMKKEVEPLSFLHVISTVPELRPLLSVRVGEASEIEEIIARKEEVFLQKVPEIEDWEFEEFMRAVKTALMFEAWINEATEDEILTKFRVTPGELRGRLHIADWLVYSLQELALLLGYKELLKTIRKLRVRLQYGIKEELIPLVRLRDVGRIRARRLFTANLRNLKDLRKISLESLSRLVGPKVASSIKDQLAGKKAEKPKEIRQKKLI